MDPSLDDAAARLTESVRRSFETLKSAKVGESVSPLVSGLFGDCLEWIAADGGTLWWLSPGDGVRCARPVELLAIYPSLLAAAGLPAVDSDRHLEGLSPTSRTRPRFQRFSAVKRAGTPDFTRSGLPKCL
jgi:hypothetical protein